MNPAIHYPTAHQRHLEAVREARRHPLGEVAARERRLSGYGARLLGLVRSQPTLRPAHDQR